MGYSLRAQWRGGAGGDGQSPLPAHRLGYGDAPDERRATPCRSDGALPPNNANHSLRQRHPSRSGEMRWGSASIPSKAVRFPHFESDFGTCLGIGYLYQEREDQRFGRPYGGVVEPT